MNRHNSPRDFLRIGVAGTGNLTSADRLRLKAQGAVDSNASSRAVIFVYLFGGPGHIDMYDLKPDAPADRGLGIDLSTTLPDHRGRPIFLLDDTAPVRELV